MEGKKVLIVEDELDIVDIYKLKLEKEGFIVEVATDWFTALTKAVTFTPHLILLDVMMPNMNWFESLTTIRNLAPSLKNTKIIMFSNLSSQDDIDKAMRNWADWYLLKSNYTPAELVFRVKEFLEVREFPHSIICPHCSHEINCDDIKI